MDPDKRKIKLSDISRKDVFKAPDGYFDSLSSRIAKRLEEKPKGKVVAFNSATLWIGGLAAAATISLLVVFGPRLISSSQHAETAEDLIAALSYDDCLAYLTSTDVTMEEILGDADEIQLIEGFGDDIGTTPEVDEDAIDLLYEKYGVTEDEKMQTL